MVPLTRGCKLLGLVVALAFARNAQAQVWTAELSGPAESPPNGSPALGEVKMILSGDLFTIMVAWSDLTSGMTATHIHCCTVTPGSGTAIVATKTFPGLIFGMTSGFYSHVFDIAADELFTAGFIAAHGGTIASAKADFFAGMDGGTAYYNIHTSVFPGGEERGFIVPTPEPASLLLLGTGLAVVGVVRRRRAR